MLELIVEILAFVNKCTSNDTLKNDLCILLEQLLKHLKEPKPEVEEKKEEEKKEEKIEKKNIYSARHHAINKSISARALAIKKAKVKTHPKMMKQYLCLYQKMPEDIFDKLNKDGWLQKKLDEIDNKAVANNTPIDLIMRNKSNFGTDERCTRETCVLENPSVVHTKIHEDLIKSYECLSDSHKSWASFKNRKEKEVEFKRIEELVLDEKTESEESSEEEIIVDIDDEEEMVS